jgi:hypothetical protein
MRYSLESALPINAFSPRGRGPFAYGMTLEGGGGSWNPVTIVENAVSSTSDALASIDPGPAIGDAGVAIDNAVNDVVPGGWVTVGAIALAVATMGASLGATTALEAGAVASADAVAAGMGFSSAAEAISAGAITAEGLGLPAATTLAELGAVEGSASAGFLGSGLEAGVAGGVPVAAEVAAPTTLTPGADAILANPAGVQVPSYTPSGTFGSLNPALPAAGSPGVAGGISAALPEGAVFGTGLNGGEIGMSYVAGPNGMVATDLFGNPIAANSINFGGFPADMGATPSSVLDSLNNARKGYNLAKTALGALTGGATMSRGSQPLSLDLSADTTGQQSSPLDLTANITKGNTDFSLNPLIESTQNATTPVVQQPSYAPTQYGMAPGTFASGGSTTGTGNSQSGNYEAPTGAEEFDLKANVTRGSTNFHLPGYEKVRIFAEGGEVEHNPEFFSEGGLGSLENRYVKGDGDGTSDEVPAMLANGEFVIPADVVSGLGNGSNDSGAKILDEFLTTLRSHKQKHDAKHLPPDSKGPLAYLLEAKKRAKA